LAADPKKKENKSHHHKNKDKFTALYYITNKQKNGEEQNTQTRVERIEITLQY
jgi:hypothetical protein